MLNLTLIQINQIKAFQTFLLCIGFIFNSWSVVVVLKYKIFPSQFTKYVMQCQFIFDAMICFLTPFILWVTKDFYDKNSSVDIFICYIWSSQCIYWMFCSFSNQNLVWTTVDRFLAVIYPTIYKLKKNLLIVSYATLVSLISISFCIEISLIVVVRNNSCIWMMPPESMIFVTSALGYAAVNYFAPGLIFVVFYFRIFLKLQAMQSSGNSSEHFRKSTITFTIASFINVVLFIVLLMMDTILFIMQCFSWYSFNVGADIQVISLFLVSINSCINPFVYLVAMKNFRRHFFLYHKFCGKNEIQSETTTTH